MTEELTSQLVLLDQRVLALEDAEKKNIEFRKAYYQDREARIYRDAQLDIKITTISENIEKLVAWQETLMNKPAKKWEMMSDKIVIILVGAIAALVLAQIGLGGV